MICFIKKRSFLFLFLALFISFGFVQTTSAQQQKVPLVWQIDSTTHPLYKGKALYPKGGSYEVIALPIGLNPQSLSYTWSQNGTILGSKSGIGRNVLAVEGELIGAEPQISVVVKNGGGITVGTGSITIPISEQSIFIYENDPLLGVWFERALQGVFPLSVDEVVLESFPFYFSRSGNIVRTWSLNNAKVEGESGGGITVRAPEESGSSRLGTTAIHQTKLLQETATNLTITFE